MPLYLRKYNDATKRYEYVLEKSWKDQREEARAAASPDEITPPARATDSPSANPSRRPWFVTLFILLGVIIVQAGLLGSILLRAAPEPKPSVPQPPAIVTEELPVEPQVAVNAEVPPPPPARPAPPPPPPPDPPIPGAPVKLLEIPKDLVPGKMQEDARAEAIAAKERAEEAFNEAADRFPKPRVRPLDPNGARIQGDFVIERPRKKVYRNWLDNHPIK